jgi:SNF2 family DNA or RNA helicase
MFKTEPRPYQKAIVEKTASMEALALFLEQGLGKTKIVLDEATVRYLKQDIEALVIISRSTVLDNWFYNEIETHLSLPVTKVYYSARNKSKMPKYTHLPKDTIKILLINDGCLRAEHGFEYTKGFLQAFKAGMIIDESTIIKNPTSQITKKVVRLGRMSVYRRILCGEPAPQGPVDYYSQYNFLHPDILKVGTFTAYKNIFCEQEQVWVNGRQINKPTRNFAANAQAAFEDLVRPYTVRLRKSDVAIDLPPKQYIKRTYELPASVATAYHRLRNEFMTELTILDSSGTLTATLAMSRAIRLQQMVSGYVVADNGNEIDIESGRFQVLCDILEERPEGAKTIIWANFRRNIDKVYTKLEERYGPGCARKVYGGLTDNDRQAALNDFKTLPSCQYLVANPATAGWGITLTESDTAIYYSNSYNWEHRVQSEDRIHRIGQLSNTVNYYDIVAAGTVDERILEILNSKADFSRSVLTDFGKWFGNIGA